MGGFAVLTFSGCLYDDPVFLTTTSGNAMVTFNLICGKCFFKVIAFEKNAEEISKLNLHKDDFFSGYGRLTQRKVEKNGSTRYFYNVILQALSIPGMNTDKNDMDMSPDKTEEFDDDNIPF